MNLLWSNSIGNSNKQTPATKLELKLFCWNLTSFDLTSSMSSSKDSMEFLVHCIQPVVYILGPLCNLSFDCFVIGFCHWFTCRTLYVAPFAETATSMNLEFPTMALQVRFIEGKMPFLSLNPLETTPVCFLEGTSLWVRNGTGTIQCAVWHEIFNGQPPDIGMYCLKFKEWYTLSLGPPVTLALNPMQNTNFFVALCPFQVKLNSKTLNSRSLQNNRLQFIV